MNRYKALSFLCILMLVITAGGCALVKPTRHFEESTPIDQDLSGANMKKAVVIPFDAKGSDIWGIYAAQRLAEYLMEQRSFIQVVYSENKKIRADYIITGTLDHLFYGGNDDPTTVILTVKVLSADESQVLFYRTVKASSEMSAFHMIWLRSIDIPSPYIEEVLNNLLEKIAKDVSSRTNLPAVQSP